MNKYILEKYNYWKTNVKEDQDLIDELSLLAKDEEKLEEAFFKDLSFGTAGLRGVIGVGTNKMNIYTVRKTSQGIANYINKEFSIKDRKVAISYDSRIKSDVFAKVAAQVFAANGVKVFIYKELMPTPCVSFAVRELACAAGVMITASHNPSKYNGYKVYGNDGCQITDEVADKITNEINDVDPFKDVKTIEFDEGLKQGLIDFITDSFITSYIERVKQESLLKNIKVDRSAKIIYTPLHGTGLKPVTRILKESGFSRVFVVKEQELPDGNFTTCPYPNPEILEAMELGIEYAKKENADLLLATDPDCDRIGIAVKDKDEFKLLSGNQTGVLLLNYICELRKLTNSMPEKPFAVKTIVSTDMIKSICDYYGVTLHNVLTGFKYIGSLIKKIEIEKPEEKYIFGFEESYGYLSGTYVRDKDAVNAALLIAEMFAYYKTKGISLIDKLNELYAKFGYCYNKCDNLYFEGTAGFKKMQEIMGIFRKCTENIGNFKVSKFIDFSSGIDGLPKADVVKFILENGASILVRPSGTEPKIKVYSTVIAKNENEAIALYEKIYGSLNKYFK